MRNYLILIGLLAASSVGAAQSLTSSDATSIQGKRVKSPLACSDGFVLTWVAANSRFECLAGGSGGGAAGDGDTVEVRRLPACLNPDCAFCAARSFRRARLIRDTSPEGRDRDAAVAPNGTGAT